MALTCPHHRPTAFKELRQPQMSRAAGVQLPAVLTILETCGCSEAPALTQISMPVRSTTFGATTSRAGIGPGSLAARCLTKEASTAQRALPLRQTFPVGGTTPQHGWTTVAIYGCLQVGERWDK